MKFSLYGLFVAVMAAAFLSSCAKDERLMFSEEPSVYFYKNVRGSHPNADSIDYSFATRNINVVQDTVYLSLRIIGVAENRDRQVTIEPTAASTAKAGYHFNLGPAVIPANAFEARVPVYLYRRPGLKDSVAFVIFEIKGSQDFKVGFPNNPRTGYKYDRLHYKVSMTDQLLRPSNWSSTWQPMFGDYSEVKFRFLISETGWTNWSSSPLPQEQRFLIQKAKLALLEYQQQHGPLLDENGLEIFFP